MTLEPLSYDANLTMEQAEQRFRQALGEFDSLRANYTGGFLNWREHKFLMSKQNQTRLANIIGVLLPLGLQPSVQDEIKSGKSIEETLFYKIQVLHPYVLDMYASFANTGAKRIGYSEPFWRQPVTFEPGKLNFADDSLW